MATTVPGDPTPRPDLNREGFVEADECSGAFRLVNCEGHLASVITFIDTPPAIGTYVKASGYTDWTTCPGNRTMRDSTWEPATPPSPCKRLETPEATLEAPTSPPATVIHTFPSRTPAALGPTEPTEGDDEGSDEPKSEIGEAWVSEPPQVVTLAPTPKATPNVARGSTKAKPATGGGNTAFRARVLSHLASAVVGFLIYHFWFRDPGDDK